MRLCSGSLHFVLIAAIALVWALPERAAAAEIFDFYQSVRQEGMGGSYVGVVDDETAILQNPAGLAKVRETSFNIFNPQIQGSFADTNTFNSGNYGQATTAQGLLTALKQSPGTPFDARASLFPSFVMPNFGVGVLGKYWYDASVDPTGKNFTLNYTNDWAAAMGFALKFFGGIVKIGFSGRLIDRTQVAQTLPASSTSLNLSALESSGLGLASDMGLIIQSPTAWLPSISAAAHDVGGTSYNLSGGFFGSTPTRPADTPTTVDCALSVFPIISRGVRAQLTAEVHDIATLGQDANPMDRYHVGGELNFGDAFFLRAGMNQGYWTAGFEFATRHFQFQAASYGEEVGTAGATVEDRRWMGSLTFRF